MSTKMPTDDNGKAIPALSLVAGGGHVIAAGDTSVSNDTEFQAATRVVSVYATVAVYISFGDSAVVASSADHYFPAGVYYDFAIRNHKRLAVTAVSDAGSVYVSEKE